jgi:TIR domain
MVSEPKKALEVFFSYSHKDRDLRDQLETHLSLLKNQGVVSSWHDRKIIAGTEWAREIDAHLNTAQIVLLLISADFIASTYCYDIEVKRAMERHYAGKARVIPIILRYCDWHHAPFGKLQALPTDGKPVDSRNWYNKDEAFHNVTQGIRKAVEDLQTLKTSAKVQEDRPEGFSKTDEKTTLSKPYNGGRKLDRAIR